MLLGLLPQNKVGGILLVVVGRQSTLAFREQLRVANLLRHQLAIFVATFLKSTCVKVHGAIGGISVPLLTQVLDVCDDLRYIFTDTRDKVRQAHPQFAHIVKEGSFIHSRKLPKVNALLGTPNDNLVIDVRDVLAQHNIIPQVVLRDATNDVELNIRASVTHVRGRVDRGAALVPQHTLALGGIHGNEAHLRPGQRVHHLQRVHAAGARRSITYWMMCGVLGENDGCVYRI